MQVQVLYFGVLKEMLQQHCEMVLLPSGATVADLLAHCCQRSAVQPQVWQSLAVAVNQQYVDASHPLQDGDEVALLPPVSGGLQKVVR